MLRAPLPTLRFIRPYALLCPGHGSEPPGSASWVPDRSRPELTLVWTALASPQYPSSWPPGRARPRPGGFCSRTWAAVPYSPKGGVGSLGVLGSGALRWVI